jgi:hypothetical protein
LAVSTPARRAWRAEQRPLVVVDDRSRDADRAEGLQHRHQAVVPLGLELAHRSPGRLGIGLGDEPVEQVVGQLGDVDQLRPRPLQGGPELGHEVAHAGLAAGDAVGEERPHEAPSQPGAEADGVVDLGHGRDAVVHQPERLAPQRLEETVGDEAVDLGREHERMHADRPVHVGGAVDRCARRRRPADHLDERQQVDRVERMADDKSFRMQHPVL